MGIRGMGREGGGEGGREMGGGGRREALVCTGIWRLSALITFGRV